MDIRELESVCAVDIYKNYSEAAFRIASSPAVISKHVSRVEDELGIRIFVRATKSRPIALTPEGAAIIGELHTIVNTYRRVTVRTAELAAAEESLTVGYAPFIGNFGEKDILAHFAFENADVTLHRQLASTKGLVSMLVTGVADAVFLPLMDGSDTFDSEYALLDDPDIVVDEIMVNMTLSLGLPDSHPLSGCVLITHERFPQLYGDTFLFSSAQKSDAGEKQRANISRLLGFSDVMRVRFVDYTEPTVALRLVESGAGVLPQACIVPRRIGRVNFIPVEGWATRTVLYLVYRRSTATRALRRLRACALAFAVAKGEPIPCQFGE